MEKFWMVWRENGGGPTRQYPAEKSAEIEAERLARENPGANFVVLESVKFCTIDNPIHWYDTSVIPF
jgi:hypothetical protein